MKHILLVFTGGTIGSQAHRGVIDTHPDAGFKLIESFRARYAHQAEIRFDILSPVQILSENLHPKAWTTLLDAIDSQDPSRYDGVIVTHGTDTLAFSAALLAIYFSALKIPLMMVSSDLPLDDPQANGVNNFICAVEFIRQDIAPGCFVAYQNRGQAMQVHIATRLSACLPLSGDFISVQSRAFMTLADGRFEPCSSLPATEPTRTRFKPQFARILLIRPYPGLDYGHYDLEGVDAVLHDLYHSGTACVSKDWGDRHHLMGFAEHCKTRNIPLYLAPAILTGNAYSSTRCLLACGAQMIWNTSLETAYAKLILAYGNALAPSEIDALLKQNLAYELIAPLTRVIGDDGQ